MSTSDRIKSTIMFTDIVGYSVMASKNQDHALKLLSTHDTIIEPIIAQNGGSVIKKIGDSIFAEFPNSKVSVHAAQEIQTKLKKRNSICNINDKIEIRIGLHTGEVIRKDDDLFGHDVNLCSRIESISPRGGIAASTDLVSSIDNEFLYREMGYIKLKNIIPPKKIYKIYLDQDEYVAESDKQLQKYLIDNGIEILDMASYTTEETFSAAILYVKNLGSSEDESIAYGLTEDLIHDFTYINNFRTSSFNDTLHYKNTELGRDDIGRKLQVENILQGSILKENNTLKLSFELLNINLGKVLWSETWSDHLSNNKNIRRHILKSVLLYFQIEIPKQLAYTLSDKITNNPDALEAYYNGKYCLDYLKSKDDLEKGKILLKKALDLDNNFIEAHHLYGIACQRLGNYDAAETALSEGQEIAETKNNLQGLAYIYKGFSTLYSAWGKWGKSKNNIEKAIKIQIQLNNQTVETMLRLDYAAILNHLGKTNLSIEQNEQALKLLKSLEDDRFFAISSIILINSYIILGDYTKSIEYGKIALGLCRRLGMTNYLGRALIMMGEAFSRTGNYEEMKASLNEAEPIWIAFDDAFMKAKINYLYAQYFLSKKDFSSTLSYIDQSIELYNLAEQTRFETQTLIEKLNIVIECGKMEIVAQIISKIDRLINKLKGAYSNELFTAMKYCIDAQNGKLDLEKLEEFYNLLEETDEIFPSNFPLTYWYLAQVYHSLNQQTNANACHKKAKNIIDILANRISGKYDKETFYKAYFHKRIQEDLI